MDITTYGALLNKVKDNKPTDAQVEQAVNDWLDDHPEATTTVEDGSITKAKLDSNLRGTVDEIGELKEQIDEISEKGIDASGATEGQVPVADGEGSWDWDTPAGGGAVEDVQVNGVSVLDAQGVANVPVANATGTYGVVRLGSGLGTSNGSLVINKASDGQVKEGTQIYRSIVPSIQHSSTFYGLAKAAGDTTQSASDNAVGAYTDAAKSAISQMLNGSVTVSGTTPSITALPGIRYVCGEVATLDITLPESGIVDVVFESGSTATVLTITPPTGQTMKWANGFDPTALEANTTYEINVADGVYGVVGQWT